MSDTLELVYMTPFVGSSQQGKTAIYKYHKLNGDVDVNKRSPDKERYAHCYDELVPGENYVVITRNYKPEGRFGRWVFTECYKLEDKRMAAMLLDRLKTLDPDHKVPGYQTTERMLRRAATDVIRVWKLRKQVEQDHKNHLKLVDELLVF